MKPFRLHRAAQAEAREAARYYEDKSERLGDRWEETFRKTLVKIRTNPSIGRIESPRYRKYAMKDFPYYIIFEDRPLYVFVFAVMHKRRRPDYWHNRP